VAEWSRVVPNVAERSAEAGREKEEESTSTYSICLYLYSLYQKCINL
jgi:hypothetical protein